MKDLMQERNNAVFWGNQYYIAELARRAVIEEYEETINRCINCGHPNCNGTCNDEGGDHVE